MVKVAVVIKPNSKHREEVVQMDDGSLMVFTKAPAIEGRANKDAVKLLAKYFSVTKSQVSLVSGHTSKRKLFEIDN